MAVAFLNSDSAARTITITASGISTAHGETRKRKLLEEEEVMSPEGMKKIGRDALMKVQEANIYSSRRSLHQQHQSVQKDTRPRNEEPLKGAGAANPDTTESSVRDLTPTEDAPFLYCASNNWTGQKMFDLLEYIKHLVGHDWKNDDDILSDLKGMGQIDRDALMSELNKRQLKMLNAEKRRYERQMLSKFERTLMANCRFLKPHVINLEGARRALEADEPVWMLPLFMKPGKQSLFFSQEEYMGEINRVRASV